MWEGGRVWTVHTSRLLINSLPSAGVIKISTHPDSFISFVERNNKPPHDDAQEGVGGKVGDKKFLKLRQQTKRHNHASSFSPLKQNNKTCSYVSLAHELNTRSPGCGNNDGIKQTTFPQLAHSFSHLPRLRSVAASLRT